MHSRQDIVKKWIARMAEFHPKKLTALRAQEPDPFCNPVGYTIRASLAQLWQQLEGDMDPDAIDSALDAIVRICAVQDMLPSQAVGLVMQLKPILREVPEAFDLVLLESKIDQLILTAFDKYMQCRDQMLAARLHETERLVWTPWVTGKGGE